MPGIDASVECFDAVLGKVHLPCLRFIVVQNGRGVVFWHPLSLSPSVCGVFSKILHFCYLAIRRKTPRGTKAPANSMWNNGEICQVLSTEAFTTIFQACDVTKGSSLPRHHCLLSPHVAEVCTVLLFTPRTPVLPTR